MPLVDYSGRYVNAGAPGGGADRVASYLRYVPCAADLAAAPGQPGPGGPSGGGPASSPGFPVFGTSYMFESSSPAAGDAGAPAGIPAGQPAAAAGPESAAAGGGGGAPAAGGVVVHNVGPGPDALPGFGTPASGAAACSPGKLNAGAPLAKYGSWLVLGLVGLGILVAASDGDRGGGRQF